MGSEMCIRDRISGSATMVSASSVDNSFVVVSSLKVTTSRATRAGSRVVPFFSELERKEGDFEFLPLGTARVAREVVTLSDETTTKELSTEEAETIVAEPEISPPLGREPRMWSESAYASRAIVVQQNEKTPPPDKGAGS